jgi:hypothetical protein
VCSSFALASEKFQLVYLIEKDEDLQHVKKLLRSKWNRENRILLWAHLQDKTTQTEAEVGLNSSWNENMSNELAQICTDNSNARMILTTDDSRVST